MLSISMYPSWYPIFSSLAWGGLMPKEKRAVLQNPGGANVGDLFMGLVHTYQLAGNNILDYISWLLKNAQNQAKSPEHYMPWKFNKLQSQS